MLRRADVAAIAIEQHDPAKAMHPEIAHDGIVSTEVGTAKPDHEPLRQALLERPVPAGQVLRL
ncbi:hypothetical protein CCR82_01930 [Halochromatium salexigens]|uniref:Uncharacterized protein n=1 Tax=Halochromatium salexigens TaxID=49447 RepID=A0AAJ0XF36_HALSE|nr:hypothetical protein [Halochromatium salexigens]